MSAAPKGRRRPEAMTFGYSGPFASLLDPIRELPVTEDRYVATPENYTIGSRVGTAVAQALESAFGRERKSAPARNKGARKRRIAGKS